jgi:FAD:protein FMN transferase
LLKENIYHPGVVKKITGKTAEVLIVSHSACASCHAKSHCSLIDQEEKIIAVPIPEGSWKIGDKVQVVLKEKAGLTAVWIAYLAPVLLVILLMIPGILLKWSELYLALGFMGIIIGYFVLLYLFRGKLNKRFTFSIQRNSGIMALVTAIGFLFTGCQQKASMVTEQGYTQGTTYTIKYYPPASDFSVSTKRTIILGIDSLFRVINQTASVYDSNSIISRFNRNEPTTLNAHFLLLLQESDTINQQSNGTFDITVGPLIKAWGFRKKEGAMLTDKQVQDLLQHTGHHLLEIRTDTVIKLDMEAKIDLNAIAQGYTVDLVAAFLEANDVTCYMVEIGGEVRAGTPKPDGTPWVIGIEKPASSDTAQQIVHQRISLLNKAIVTSGNYRNYFLKDGKKYTHLIDPRTGYPESNQLLGVSVIANDCMTADALATAMMVMGKSAALELVENRPETEAYLIYIGSDSTFQTTFSSGFEKFFTD